MAWKGYVFPQDLAFLFHYSLVLLDFKLPAVESCLTENSSLVVGHHANTLKTQCFGTNPDLDRLL